MEESPSITVICSTYNSARWIDGYLQSMNQQLLKYFDIIFVDANSDDGSLDIIKNFEFREGIETEIVEYAEKIPIYEAWNIAISRAKTPYVINVNTDDRLFPAGLISYLNYALAAPSGDIFYSSYVQCGDPEHKQVTGFFYTPEHAHDLLLQFCYGGPFPMLKRQTIIEEGMFDPNYDISGDYEMWLRLSKNGKNFVRIPECLGTYYMNPEGVSTDIGTRMKHVQQDIELRELYK